MGSYSINIDLGIPTDTRENLIQYYEFIDTWSDLLNLENKKIEANFQYSIGKITCTSDTFEEFKNESIGQQIRLVHMIIHVKSGNEQLYYITIDYRHKYNLENVYIACNSRNSLSQLLDCIEEAKVKYFPNGSGEKVIEQHIHGDQISITGSQISGSNIGGKHNTINEQGGSKEKSTRKTIGEMIVANIASNAIWWGLGIIIVAILVYLGVKNP